VTGANFQSAVAGTPTPAWKAGPTLVQSLHSDDSPFDGSKNCPVAAYYREEAERDRRNRIYRAAWEARQQRHGDLGW